MQELIEHEENQGRREKAGTWRHRGDGIEAPTSSVCPESPASPVWKMAHVGFNNFSHETRAWGTFW